MSGAFAGVPNTFQNAVTATGLQLDQNFNTFTAYVNDPTNRYNFATDGAVTNTVILTNTPPVAGGYTTGLELTWKWGATNTGATVLNSDGLGQASVVNPDGSALTGGQGTVGSIGRAQYDGTRFIYVTPPSPASAAQMSAAVTLVPYVSPGRMGTHPGVAKANAYFVGTAAGTITPLTSYNIGSITHPGTGTYSISLSTGFASTAWISLVLPGQSISFRESSKGTGFVVINTFDSAGGAEDATRINFVAFGPQ